MTKELPLCFYPTQIILIDDDVNYTKNVEMFMLSKEIPVKIFNNPLKAIPYIMENVITKLSENLFNIEDEFLEKTTFNVSFKPLQEIVYNKNRFQNFSVLVVDFAMPEMNGQELVTQLKDLPIKKLLLTGEADYSLAVKMFNAGLIDRFFRKSDDNLLENIVKEIEQLKVDFFVSLSKPVLSALAKKSSIIPFADSKFVNFFTDLFKKNKIAEYYALDESASYLLLTKTATSYGLIVKSEEDMQTLIELAENEKGISSDLLQSIKDKKKLAYFHNVKELSKPVKDWKLYDAHELSGSSQKYYYALVKDVADLFNLDQSKIISYQKFLDLSESY